MRKLVNRLRHPPLVAAVRKLHLEPSDTLLVETDTLLSREQTRELARVVQDITGHERVAVHDPGVQFAVLDRREVHA
jgi:hypothetical protein